MVRTLKQRISLITVRVENKYTLSKLKAHPLGASCVDEFEAIRVEWPLIFEEELGLLDERAQRQADIDICEAAINDCVSRISKAILAVTQDNRDHPIYVRYMDTQRPWEIYRLALDPKLESVRGWVPSLMKSEHPHLAALGLELEALVKAADEAIEKRAIVEQKWSDFQMLENRKAFIDRVNAARKVSHAALGKLPHLHVGLPADFADHFFMHGRREDGGEEEPDESSVKTVIITLKAQLAAQEELLADMEAEAKQEALEVAEIEAEESTLAELQKNKAVIEEQEATILAKLAAKSSVKDSVKGSAKRSKKR